MVSGLALPARRRLREISERGGTLRVAGREGEWLDAEFRLPGFAGDGLARTTLTRRSCVTPASPGGPPEPTCRLLWYN